MSLEVGICRAEEERCESAGSLCAMAWRERDELRRRTSSSYSMAIHLPTRSNLSTQILAAGGSGGGGGITARGIGVAACGGGAWCGGGGGTHFVGCFLLRTGAGAGAVVVTPAEAPNESASASPSGSDLPSSFSNYITAGGQPAVSNLATASVRPAGSRWRG